MVSGVEYLNCSDTVKGSGGIELLQDSACDYRGKETDELPSVAGDRGGSVPDSPLIALVLVIGPLLELPTLSITANLRLGIRSKKIAESQS